MTSFDISSLFTNIPLQQCNNIVLDNIFINPNTTYHGFNRNNFKKLLELATGNSVFLFNKTIYEQIDGVAMGSPLGPTLANIFMCHLENKYINDCPSNFKPLLYKRYVDDTFALFKTQAQAIEFHKYINNWHSNISFTNEPENEGKLSFLDICIEKTHNNSLLLSTGNLHLLNYQLTSSLQFHLDSNSTL